MAKVEWTTVAILEPSKPQFKNGVAVEWKVQRNPAGALRCHCPAFIFSKDSPKTCKHIRSYQSQTVQALPAPTQVTPTGPPAHFVEAVKIFDAMCAAGSTPVRSVKAHLDARAQKAMVDALAMRLAAWVPTSTRVVAAVAETGVRRITFDDN